MYKIFLLPFFIIEISTTPINLPDRKLENAQEKISLAIRNSIIETIDVKERINYVLYNAQRSIDTNFLQLQQLEKQGQTEEKILKVEIDECLRDLQSSIVNIDLNGLEQCQTSVVLSASNKKIEEIKLLSAKLQEEFLKCREMDLDNEKDYCTKKLFSDVVNRLKPLQNQLKSSLQKAESNNFSCVQAYLFILDSKIDVIGHSFRKCYIDKNEKNMDQSYLE